METTPDLPKTIFYWVIIKYYSFLRRAVCRCDSYSDALLIKELLEKEYTEYYGVKELLIEKQECIQLVGSPSLED